VDETKWEDRRQAGKDGVFESSPGRHRGAGRWRGIGRIRLARIPDGSAKHLHQFIQGAIVQGSCVHTDGWKPYQGLEQLGYQHEVSKLKGQEISAATELLPRVHRVAALLKRWLLGTHQGAIAPEHLEYYLDEFTFRFNRRTSASRGKLFYRLAQQAVQVSPVPYKTLVGGATNPNTTVVVGGVNRIPGKNNPLLVLSQQQFVPNSTPLLPCPHQHLDVGSYRLKILSAWSTFRSPIIRSCACFCACGKSSNTWSMRPRTCSAWRRVQSVFSHA